MTRITCLLIEFVVGITCLMIKLARTKNQNLSDFVIEFVRFCDQIFRSCGRIYQNSGLKLTVLWSNLFEFVFGITCHNYDQICLNSRSWSELPVLWLKLLNCWIFQSGIFHFTFPIEIESGKKCFPHKAKVFANCIRI